VDQAETRCSSAVWRRAGYEIETGLAAKGNLACKILSE
jgi:hypothetical protein